LSRPAIHQIKLPMDNAVSRLEAVAARLEKAVAAMGGEVIEEGSVPQYVTDYEAILAKEGEAFFKAVEGIANSGMDAAKVRASFERVAAYLKMTTVCKKPSTQECVEFCKEAIVDGAQWADDLTRTRVKKWFKFGNFHKALKEVMATNYWVSMYPPQLPASHCKGQLEAADFHLNRILTKDGKTDENLAFVKNLKALIKAVEEFVKANFKTGIDFVGQESIKEAKAPAAGAKPKAKAAPAPEEEVAPKKEDTAAAEQKANALLGALNKGLKATSGLKKVKKEQKNKYKKEKVSGKVTMATKKAKVKNKKKAVKKKQGPFNWAYCNYTDAEGLQEINNDDGKLTMKNGLNFQDCANAQFKVDCKVKSVTIDGCRRCSFQISDVVSAVEIVNSRDIKIWCMGLTPAVSIDKSDSPHIYFTAGCIETTGGIPEVTAACVTAGNIEIPGKTNDDDMQCIPIPEQFVIRSKADGTCEAVPMDHGD